MIKFLRELADLSIVLANLTQQVKKEICYPSGLPFRNVNININSHNYSYNDNKKDNSNNYR